ncbi:MAG: BspA family leucine-rich repeat surface protein [Alphaproteobacteria bacterium]|nr:BspA family leucine-rich repeat surface protein [Alphaproteobacteria bacterium]
MFCRAVVWAFLLIFGIVLNLQAKVYWLPDYLVQGATRGSTVAPTKTKLPLTCSTYGHKTATEASGMNCESTISINGVGECFVGCKEPSPCDLVNGLSCQYGCKQYFATCASECEVCYADNCHNRTDNRTDYGCTSYWSDCSSKCELGKTCTKTDCSGFTLSSAPANASYSTCTPGCGDNTPRYKITACTPGLTLKDGTCQDLGSITVRILEASMDDIISGVATASVTVKGTDIVIDWGNGEIDKLPGDSSNNTHKSNTVEKGATITITGNISEFAGIVLTDGKMEIVKFNLSTLKKASFGLSCDALVGEIPELPPNLENAKHMFSGCNMLTGSIPEFPNTLTDASYMFNDCYNMTGDVPRLPSTLTNASNMFRNASGLTGCLNRPSSITKTTSYNITDITKSSGINLSSEWEGYSDECTTANFPIVTDKTLPEGTVVYLCLEIRLPDGTNTYVSEPITLPDGTIIHNNRTVEFSDGTLFQDDRLSIPNGLGGYPGTQTTLPDGTYGDLFLYYGIEVQGANIIFPNGLIYNGSSQELTLPAGGVAKNVYENISFPTCACDIYQCPTGQAKNVSECGPAVENGYWELTTISGYPSQYPCKQCTLACNPGYGLIDGTCKPASVKFKLTTKEYYDNHFDLLFAVRESKEVIIDWGDGSNEERFVGLSNVQYNPSHEYKDNSAEYIITITGEVSELLWVYTNSTSTVEILQFNLPSLIRAELEGLWRQLVGTIPEFPPNLQYADFMFHGCTNLTGNIPHLPDSLISMDYMFYGAEQLTGCLNRPLSVSHYSGQEYDSTIRLSSEWQGYVSDCDQTYQAYDPSTGKYNEYSKCSCDLITQCPTGLVKDVSECTSPITNGYYVLSPVNNNTIEYPCMACTPVCNFGYVLQDGVCQEKPALIFTVESEQEQLSNGTINLTIHCTNSTCPITIDWGDGQIEQFTGYAFTQHIYETMLPYTVKIIGDIEDFRYDDGTAVIKSIQQMNIPTLKSMDIYATKCYLTGQLPALPPNLQNGNSLFRLCTGITGSIPALPSTLTDATYMFQGCTGLTGSIPELPSALSYGTAMFRDCTGLTGRVPTLPPTIRNASYMFYGCTGLTGSIPEFPTFTNYPGLDFTYSKCSGLSGISPKRANYVNGQCLFYGTQVTNDGSWSDSEFGSGAYSQYCSSM